MKKICIATWYEPGNFGTGLQAVALSHFLETEGYQTCFIDDRRGDSPTPRIELYCYFLKEILSGRWFFRRKYKEQRKIQMLMQKQFMNRYESVFTINTESDLEKINKEVDTFISGGDQIWNPWAMQDVFLLSFVWDGNKRIAFGSSVGVKEIPDSKKEIYQKNLNKYSKIGVREETSAIALRQIINREIEVVSDPTMLFSGEEWDFLLRESSIDPIEFSDPYVLCYFVGERKSYWRYVEKIRKQTKYRVVVVPINSFGYKNKYEKYVKVSPPEFLWLIKNATIICTDSFHATLFSVKFGKEFYSLKRFTDTDMVSQNSRLYDFLQHIGLEKRIVEDESIFLRNASVDYESIRKQQTIEKEEARKWLIEAIQG